MATTRRAGWWGGGATRGPRWGPAGGGGVGGGGPPVSCPRWGWDQPKTKCQNWSNNNHTKAASGNPAHPPPAYRVTSLPRLAQAQGCHVTWHQQVTVQSHHTALSTTLGMSATHGHLIQGEGWGLGNGVCRCGAVTATAV